jgi:hypothetical protein
MLVDVGLTRPDIDAPASRKHLLDDPGMQKGIPTTHPA